VLLFSDDPIKTAAELQPALQREFPHLSVTVMQHTTGQSLEDRDLHDFVLMTACRVVITANSTFSWWAATLHHLLPPPRTTICPRHWFVDQPTMPLDVSVPEGDRWVTLDENDPPFLDTIDMVLYINLSHRVDRKEHIHTELQGAGVPERKITRIEAILQPCGAMGCTMSHIKALRHALQHPEWHRVLVLEDDFTFRVDGPAALCTLIETDPTMDVCLLSYEPSVLQHKPTNQPNVQQVVAAQTSAGYIVSRAYIPSLLQNFEDGLHDMKMRGKEHSNCMDIYWQRLQSRDRWYTHVPSIGYQMDGYSDIVKTDVVHQY
jgi:hypothetical protein